MIQRNKFLQVPYLLIVLLAASSSSQVYSMSDVYVATTGNDGNPGTIGSPVLTISVALTKVASGGTVHLANGTYNATAAGHQDVEITIAQNVSITGHSATDTFIDGNNLNWIFSISPGYIVTLTNITFQNGFKAIGPGAIGNGGTATVNSSIFSHNSSQVYGGAIANAGTMTCTNCVFSYNSSGAGAYHGGAIYNVGPLATGVLTVNNCNFSYNTADLLSGQGGAIFNAATLAEAPVNVYGCTFIGNSAGKGGAVANNIVLEVPLNISCCRFSGNKSGSSTTGAAIYNIPSSSALNVENNWWGTNEPDFTSLISGPANYIPYTTVSISINPPNPTPGNTATVTARFTTCIPDGTPVGFSTTNGTVAPLSDLTSNNTAQSTLTAGYGLAQVCAIVGPGAENYSIGQTVLSNVGYYRLNWGCTCADGGTDDGTLVAAWNDHNGYQIIATTTLCAEYSSTISVSGQLINNIAVANTEAAIYIAYVALQAGNYSTKVCAFTAGGFSTTTTVRSGTNSSLVQWYGLSGTQAFLASEDNSNIYIDSINLTTLSSTPLTSVQKNTAGPSIFLYWYSQGSDLFVLRGCNLDQVETYTVNLSAPSISYFKVTPLFDFSTIKTCSTCANYLVIGGAGTTLGRIIPYTIDTSSGVLNPDTSHITNIPGSTVVNRIEKCCCAGAQLLVATDNGLYSYGDPSSWTSPISSIPNGFFTDCCWCCMDNGTIGLIQRFFGGFVGEILTQNNVTHTFDLVCTLTTF